jgi:hypothetical protein
MNPKLNSISIKFLHMIKKPSLRRYGSISRYYRESRYNKYAQEVYIDNSTLIYLFVQCWVAGVMPVLE